MKKVLSLILIIILGVNVCSTSIASSLSEKKKEQSDLANEIKETEAKIQEIKTEKSEAESAIDKLNTQIENTQSEIETLETDISSLESNIETLTKELEEAEINLEKQEELLEKRLVAMYKSGSTSYLEVLLSSTSLSDFLSKYKIIGIVAENDKNLVDEVQNQKNEIETKKSQLEEQKEAIEIAKSNKEEKVTTLNNNKQQKSELISELTEEQKKEQESLDQMREDKKKIDAEISSYTASNKTYSSAYTGGTMAWPVPGYTRVSCGYLGYSGHYAIDIASSGIKGASVVAAADGVVVTSKALKNSKGEYRSYGEYIIIDHGGGVMTVYAHGLEGSRKVSPGQTVTKGQTIMQVGSTGNSTGPHLHFEIRENGKNINPLDSSKGYFK